VLSNQKWAFFSIGIIYNDLMNVQKRLIHTYYSEQRKLVNYFVWTQKQYRTCKVSAQYHVWIFLYKFKTFWLHERNNERITKWSSVMDIDTPTDCRKINFVFV
jgi:hypothetical protein